MHQRPQPLQIDKGYQIDLVLITELEGQVDQVRQIAKVSIEVEEEPIDLPKVKTVQLLTIVLERQFEGACKTDLEFLPGPLLGQTVQIIDQVFRLA